MKLRTVTLIDGPPTDRIVRTILTKAVTVGADTVVFEPGPSGKGITILVTLPKEDTSRHLLKVPNYLWPHLLSHFREECGESTKFEINLSKSEVDASNQWVVTVTLPEEGQGRLAILKLDPSQ